MTRYDIVVNSEELCLHTVAKDGKWGVFNSRIDEEIVPTLYDEVIILSSDYFAVKANDLWGVIKIQKDSALEYVINIGFDWICDLDDDFFLLEKDDEYKLFNKSSHETSKFYARIKEFDGEYSVIIKNNLRGIISRDKLVEIIPPMYSSLSHIEDEMYLAEDNEKYYILNLRLNTKTPLEYEGVDKVNSNYFVVKKNSLYGVLDSNFNVVIPIKYNFISYPFDDVDDVFIVRENASYGFINLTRNIFVKCIYKNVRKLKPSILSIQNQSNKYALFDTLGNQLTKFEYDTVRSSRNNIIVGIDSNSKDGTLLFGLLNDYGKELIPPLYQDITPLGIGGFKVRLHDKVGFYDSNYNLACKIIYDDILHINETNKIGKKIATVVLNDTYGDFYW